MERPRSCSPLKLRTSFSNYSPPTGLLNHVRDTGLRHGMTRLPLTTGCWNNPASGENGEFSALPEPMQPACAYTCSGFGKRALHPCPPTNQLLNARRSQRERLLYFWVSPRSGHMYPSPARYVPAELTAQDLKSCECHGT